MSDPADIGARVLEGGRKGRELARTEDAARVARVEREIRRALDVDVLEGHREWGRAVRIAKRLRIPRRTVAKYLARLSQRANSSEQTPAA